MKKCAKCNIEKNEEDFTSKELKYKSGGKCKKCVSEYQKEYYKNHKEQKKKYIENNKEEIKIKSKEYRENHKEKRKEYQKGYRENHKEELLKYNKNYQKEYREDNKEELKIKNKIYRENHKEEIKEKNRKYLKNKRLNDPAYKLKSNISRQIGKALKRSGGSKNGNSCLDFLPGYNLKQLEKHLEDQFEPWMNWSNHGVLKNWDDNDPTTWTWQLDHKIPQSDLPYTSMEDKNFKICWSLSNLRPLSAKQNNSDGSNRTRHKKKDK